jgi:hypothetical protein
MTCNPTGKSNRTGLLVSIAATCHFALKGLH